MKRTGTIDELFERRSVRVYEKREIEPEAKRLILQSALQAPTAGNMVLYSMIEVADPEKKKRLSELCDNQPFIERAPFVLFFAADFQRWYDGFFRVTKSEVRRPTEGDFLLAYMDALIAAQNTVVAAQSLGIGSCYIGDIIEHGEELGKLLALPRYTAPAALLCFGYPTQQQRERQKPQRVPLESVAFTDEYRTAGLSAQDEMYGGASGAERAFDDLLNRKWAAPFMEEMGRSARYWLARWSEPMEHEMKLEKAPFEKLRRGEKTIELRLDDAKRRLVAPGDKITFSLSEEPGEKLTARVRALHRFGSFAELFAALPSEKCGYGPGETPSPADMREYYSHDAEKRWGVVGIELELLE